MQTGSKERGRDEMIMESSCRRRKVVPVKVILHEQWQNETVTRQMYIQYIHMLNKNDKNRVCNLRCNALRKANSKN